MHIIDIAVNNREHATILAALRLYQAHLDSVSEHILDIASDGGTLVPLTEPEIDYLVEHLNVHEGDLDDGAATRRAGEGWL